MIGHIGAGGGRLYESKDPTNSVKALKEDRVLMIIEFNPIRSTSPCYNNIIFMQYEKILCTTSVHNTTQTVLI